MTDARRQGRRRRPLRPGWSPLLAAAAVVLATACTPDPEPAREATTGTALTGIRYLADAGDSGDGYARAIEPRRFEFPADHGPHPAYRTEWWYFTGNLFDESGAHYGFELTLFRLALAPATGNALPRASTFATREAWMGNFAITDTERRQFQVAERLSRGAAGLAGASRTGDDVSISIEDWSIAFAGDSVTLEAQDASFGIELTLDGLNRIVTQGDSGLDPKGPEPGNASYYFSAPRLAVSGQLRSAGEPEVTVSGTAWMDREWGTSALSPYIEGWDWFALQLDDGRDLMFYRLRETDGGTSPFSGGTLIDPAGNVTRLDAGATVLDATRTWTSSASGVTYPIEWRLTVPAEQLDLEIVPRLDAQEIDLTVRYWEGAVAVSGESGSQPIAGVGYLELAGY